MSVERILEWPTPISKWRRPEMISLTDTGELRIVIGDPESSENRIIFLFRDGIQAYKSTSESYLNDLWNRKKDEDVGWTFILRPSRWIAELAKDPVFDSMWSLNKGELEHYVLATGEDVLEVISYLPPKISSSFEASLT